MSTYVHAKNAFAKIVPLLSPVHQPNLSEILSNEPALLHRDKFIFIALPLSYSECSERARFASWNLDKRCLPVD